MRILVIQFDADKGLGILEQPLRDLGCEIDVRLAPAEPLSLDGVDGLIVLGGLANPDDPDPAVAVAAGALRRGAGPAACRCSASASAPSCSPPPPAPPRRACEAEFGFRTVRLEPAAGDDPLLGDLPESFEVFEAHGYTWEPPAGSTVLAHTELTRQAFHLPPLAWGIQFHFEADEATLLHLAGSEPTASVFEAHGVDLAEFTARAGDVTGAWVDGSRRDRARLRRRHRPARQQCLSLNFRLRSAEPSLAPRDGEVRGLDDLADSLPVDVVDVEIDADPAAMTHVRRPEEPRRFRLDQRFLRAGRRRTRTPRDRRGGGSRT